MTTFSEVSLDITTAAKIMDDEYSFDTAMEALFTINQNRMTNTTCESLKRSDFYQLLVSLADNQDVQLNETNCSSATQDSGQDYQHERVSAWVMGRLFYAYFTPFVFFIGILGNSLSLGVFVSKNMRNLSASYYLAALSISDLMALVCYVLMEWLIRGIPVLNSDLRVSFMHKDGLCQSIMYFHYVSRFLSAWLVVAFTIERYIGVCHPFKRRHICSKSSAKKIIIGLVLISGALNVFKPLLSVVHDVKLWGAMCTTNPNHRGLSFILDSIYAVTITFIPFVIITILNILIIRQLVLHKRQQKLVRHVTEESVIRLEFTLILLVVSFCFVALNLPYFATWCKLFFTSRYVNLQSFQDPDELDYFRGVAFFTRAIFYINYCINFFLYSITGAYFRRELSNLFSLRSHRYTGSSHRSRKLSQSTLSCQTVQSKLFDKSNNGGNRRNTVSTHTWV